MKRSYTYQFTAFSDAAGKYNPAAPREGNEDNMFYSLNLSGSTQQDTNKWFSLDNLGIVLAVADGMGGMNAGEVASQIAIDTVKYFFSCGKITKKIAEKDSQRQAYLEKIIVAADEQIKHMASEREDRRGMGSTLILLWLFEDRMTISWIGDSRAYRYNPNIGIQPLSKDHSYVQELVDKGVITYEQSFDHPQGNIITKSLGDPSKKAQPESRHFKVYDGDILMLCSDGLSGVLRDSEIEQVMHNNNESIEQCQERLWYAAKEAEWYDNVTTLLCKVKGGEVCPSDKGALSCGEIKSYWKKSVHITRNQLGLASIAILLVFLFLILLLFGYRNDTPVNTIEDKLNTIDSCKFEDKGTTVYQNTEGNLYKESLPQEQPVVIPTRERKILLDSEQPKVTVELTPITESDTDIKEGLTPLPDTDTINGRKDTTTIN